MYLPLALSLVLNGAPPTLVDDDGSPLQRKHHRRVVKARAVPLGPAFAWEGTLAAPEDGIWGLRRILQESTRRRLAEAQQKPLRDVPKEIRRSFAIAPEGPDPETLERAQGRRVRAVLRHDPSGQSFLVKLEVLPRLE